MEEDGNISGFVGKCSEYIDYREEKRKEEKALGGIPPLEGVGRSLRELTEFSSKTRGEGETSPSSASKKKRSFKEQKEFEQLDAEIPALEAEQKSLEADMASTDFAVVKKAGDRYNEIARLLEEKYPRWEELAERA
jgi:ATP-binding cassette subfamily F protein uup